MQVVYYANHFDIKHQTWRKCCWKFRMLSRFQYLYISYHIFLIFQTLFSIKSDVLPSSNNKVCMTGSLSKLNILVHQMPGREPLNDQDLLYEVIGQSFWNIHGKSTGVVFNCFVTFKIFITFFLTWISCDVSV